MMKTRHYIAVLLSLSAAFSCGDNGWEEPDVKAELEVSGISTVQNVISDASNLVVSVKSNVRWNVRTGTEDWIRFDRLDGDPSEEKLTLSFDANTAEESRRSSFSITAGQLSRQFTIVQAAYEKPLDPVSLSVSGIEGNKVATDYAGTEVRFSVSCNYAWAIDATSLDFAVVDPQQGDAGEVEVLLSIPVNTARESRQGSFTVRCKEETVVIAVEQGPAPEPAVINLTGSESNFINCEAQDLDFKVNSNYDWTITATDLDWAAITPVSGAKGEDVSVKVSVSANADTQQRSGNFTITAQNAVKTVTITQAAFVPEPEKYDTHSAGFVFFSDDFAWVASTWDMTYPKYGWISAKTDGSHNNEYTVNSVSAAKAEADRIGYICDDCCYAKAEGFIKLGKSAQIGSITTPALSGIDAESVATLDVSFNSGLYCSASRTPDSYGFIQIGVVGEGTIVACGTASAVIAADGKSVEVPLLADDDHIWNWTKKHLIVQGADSQTKIRFGSSDAKQGRCFVDDISVVRAADGSASPAADEISAPAIDCEASLTGDGKIAAEGGNIGALLRINADYEVRSDASWLTISRIAYATSATAVNSDGVVIADDSMSATVTRTAMPYNRTLFAAAANTSSSSRTAHVTVSAGGRDLATLTVVQDGMSYTAEVLAKWSWTGLVAGGALDAMVTDWVSGTHTYMSDAVEGGTFTAVARGSAAAFSTGTSTQKKDRLRINKMSVNDYFQFSVANVTAAAGNVIKFSGVGIATTAVTTGPVNWIEEYSIDGGSSWTTIDTIQITAANKAFDLGCEIILPSAISNASVQIRARIADNKTSNGEFVDGNSNIGMIMLNEDAKVTSNNEHYTEAWAYATISLLKL